VEAVADAVVDALVAGVEVDEMALMPLAGALSLGEPEDEVERLAREAAAAVWTDGARAALAARIAERRADPLANADALAAAERELDSGRFANRLARVSALRLLTRDPVMREHLGSLEEYLELRDDDEYRALGLPLAGEAALPAAAIDLERALHEAGLYVDSYPKVNLVSGDLPELASAWLAERLTLTEDAGAARPRMRRAVAAFAEAAEAEFPRAARALREVLAAPQPESPLEDDLWQAFAARIVGRKVVDVGW